MSPGPYASGRSKYVFEERVRQWQELLHEKNYAESYTEALPDFVKLAEAYGAVGIRATTPDEVDVKIKQMIKSDKPVLFD